MLLRLFNFSAVDLDALRALEDLGAFRSGQLVFEPEVEGAVEGSMTTSALTLVGFRMREDVDDTPDDPPPLLPPEDLADRPELVDPTLHPVLPPENLDDDAVIANASPLPQYLSDDSRDDVVYIDTDDGTEREVDEDGMYMTQWGPQSIYEQRYL